MGLFLSSCCLEEATYQRLSYGRENAVGGAIHIFWKVLHIHLNSKVPISSPNCLLSFTTEPERACYLKDKGEEQNTQLVLGHEKTQKKRSLWELMTEVNGLRRKNNFCCTFTCGLCRRNQIQVEISKMPICNLRTFESGIRKVNCAAYQQQQIKVSVILVLKTHKLVYKMKWN